MGTRTYEENEGEHTELRPDLLAKLTLLDADAPTAEEKQAGGVSKVRAYQQH